MPRPIADDMPLAPKYEPHCNTPGRGIGSPVFTRSAVEAGCVSGCKQADLGQAQHDRLVEIPGQDGYGGGGMCVYGRN